MLRSRHFGILAGVLGLAGVTSASAAPELRYQVDQEGDFLLFGNTFGYECATDTMPIAVPAPVVGTVDCSSVVDAGVAAESSPDIFWRADAPNAGEAVADDTITAAESRSTAVLVLPEGASVSYARIYWAGYLQGDTQDVEVRIERPGDSLNELVEADDFVTAFDTSTTDMYWYQSTADVTSLVAGAGPGPFRVSEVDTWDLTVAGQNVNHVLSAWTVVVFYELETDPSRNLALFDGLDAVNATTDQNVSISGFLVPSLGFDAKLGMVTYEGEAEHTGDSIFFNDTQLSDSLNPADNFFNGSRTFLGMPISNEGDLPQLTGNARSMAGVDMDVIDVSDLVQSGDTSATIDATSTSESFLLGAFVTSISTFSPNFASSGKSVEDVDGGSVAPGDVLEYTITAVNTGNDPSVNTVLNDALPDGLTYLPGSIEIVSGPNAGSLTDEAGDDQGEYDEGSRTITVRLGDGADATEGGSLAVDEQSVVTFRVTVDEDASGTIENQAFITAEGEHGAPETDYPTDGNGGDPGAPPTGIEVDECQTDDDCGGSEPVCNIFSIPRVCVECLTSADCTEEDALDCNPETFVCECFDNLNCFDTDGDGASDGFEEEIGTDPNDADSDDDGVIDGSEPDPAGDADGDGDINALDPDADDDGLFDGTELGFGCDNDDTDLSAETCIPDGDEGATTTNPLDPDTDDGSVSDGDEDANHNGVIDDGETDPNDGSDDLRDPDQGEGGAGGDSGEACSEDSDCGGRESGRVCNDEGICDDGCRGSDGNGCPSGEECTSDDDSIGECVTETGSGGTSGDDDDDLADGVLEGGGCSCSIPARDSRGLLVSMLGIGALLMGWGRRRRRFVRDRTKGRR